MSNFMLGITLSSATFVLVCEIQINEQTLTAKLQYKNDLTNKENV